MIDRQVSAEEPERRNGKLYRIRDGLYDQRLHAQIGRGLDHVEIAAALGSTSRVVWARLRGMGLV